MLNKSSYLLKYWLFCIFAELSDSPLNFSPEKLSHNIWFIISKIDIFFCGWENNQYGTLNAVIKAFKKRSRERDQDLSEDEKNKKRQYGSKRHKNFSEDEKQKLLDNRKNTKHGKNKNTWQIKAKIAKHIKTNLK